MTVKGNCLLKLLLHGVLNLLNSKFLIKYTQDLGGSNVFVFPMAEEIFETKIDDDQDKLETTLVCIINYLMDKFTSEARLVFETPHIPYFGLNLT